ncbi:MAG: dimethylsulfonioproprionate lyase family protein [Pseudomonadota bacterium]
MTVLQHAELPLSRSTYDPLLDALLSFVARYDDPAIAPFRDDVANWDDGAGREARWNGGALGVSVLQARRFVPDALNSATDVTRSLLSLLDNLGDALFWEQSYTAGQALVGDDMLTGYGFVEVIGKRGPFVSHRVRVGIGVWGPEIVYPEHHHAAAEIYVPLGGEAVFSLEGDEPRVATAGESVVVRPHRRHGFTTRARPLAVFYIWRAGDLRETSTFTADQAGAQH